MQEMFLNLQIKSHKIDMRKLYKHISGDIIKILELSGILGQKKKVKSMSKKKNQAIIILIYCWKHWTPEDNGTMFLMFRGKENMLYPVKWWFKGKGKWLNTHSKPCKS